MEIAKIQQLIDAIGSSDLTELSLEEGGEKLTLKREKMNSDRLSGESGRKLRQEEKEKKTGSAAADDEAASGREKPLPAASDANSENSEAEGKVITSPMVGTFYSSPSEEDAPFVKIGDRIKKGQILGIIETMKLMNEITSDREGILTEVLVENEQIVEYGQGLFRIQ